MVQLFFKRGTSILSVEYLNEKNFGTTFLTKKEQLFFNEKNFGTTFLMKKNFGTTFLMEKIWNNFLMKIILEKLFDQGRDGLSRRWCFS